MEVSKILFDGWDVILRTILVAVVAYSGLVLLLRISGKRTLAKLNAFDWVVTVAFGSTLATILLNADVALAEGLVAFTLLILLQWSVARLSVAWPPFKELIRSEPRLLLENGRVMDSALKRERVTRSEIEAAVRNEGFGDLDDIAAVVLETDGSFSVIPKEKAGERTALRSVEKRDDDGA
jgi:uncharacterized membrane protein YcaP (DUF421 family)